MEQENGEVELERILSTLPDEPIHVSFRIHRLHQKPELCDVFTQLGLAEYHGRINGEPSVTNTHISLVIDKKEAVELYRRQLDNSKKHHASPLSNPSFEMQSLRCSAAGYEIQILPVFDEVKIKYISDKQPAFLEQFKKAIRENNYAMRCIEEHGTLVHPDSNE